MAAARMKRYRNIEVALCLIVALCLPILLHAPQAQAEEFGRLFTNEQERRNLDALRTQLQGLPIEEFIALPDSPSVTDTIISPPTEIVFSGFVKRSDGKYALWINGKSSLSPASQEIDQASFSASHPSALLRSNELEALMKPGQIWSLDSNTIREGYYRDRVIPKSP